MPKNKYRATRNCACAAYKGMICGSSESCARAVAHVPFDKFLALSLLATCTWIIRDQVASKSQLIPYPSSCQIYASRYLEQDLPPATDRFPLAPQKTYQGKQKRQARRAVNNTQKRALRCESNGALLPAMPFSRTLLLLYYMPQNLHLAHAISNKCAPAVITLFSASRRNTTLSCVKIHVQVATSTAIVSLHPVASLQAVYAKGLCFAAGLPWSL